ncbi:unnamed protein product [Chilo suppressalis]|uniref:Uncharacterized protein n=1 Tax=Chilo suppressalis TaxID=168631 RepID=A0ABN8L9Y9_CHISP|nr:unnamed protein product [Chilo suppressalis]
MFGESDSINQTLVSNIVNANRFSHCRLCLQFIEKHFVRFHDLVTIDQIDFIPLSNVLTVLFGNNLSLEEIPGIEAVCTECVNKTLEAMRFLELCKNANKKLYDIFDKLAETLNGEIDLSCQNQSLYIALEDNTTKILLVKNKKNMESKSKKGQHSFECFLCDDSFIDLDELKTHNLSLHGFLTCELCHETYVNNAELLYHVNNAHKYKCDKCQIRKDTQDQLDNHIDSAHTLHECKKCGISCTGRDNLRSHEDKHSNNSYKKNQCPKCGKVYSTKGFFLKHVKLCFEDLIDPHPIRSEIVKTFFCNICGKGYSSYGSLRVHNRFTHGNAKPHVCKQCGKKFTAPSYLKVHMIKHTGEKNFKCNICGNRFVSKEALLYHTRRHTGEKPYTCKHCDERFVNASARTEHIKFKHIGPTLMCEICSQKFVTTHFLKQHMNKHYDPTSKLYVSRVIPPN